MSSFSALVNYSLYTQPSPSGHSHFTNFLVLSISSTSPINSIRLLLVYAIRSGAIYDTSSSCLVLIFHAPCSVTFLKSFLSHVLNITLSFPIMDCVSHPHITTGCNAVLYISSFFYYSTQSSRLKNIYCKP
jgi:hypothetical protein